MLIALILGYAFALSATALFLYALWKLLRSFALRERFVEFVRALGLARDTHNPVIIPGHDWEASGVMNPAAVEAGGRVHLFYRAVGGDGVSRIGYASSKDGAHFDDRLPYPVFALQNAPDTTAFATTSGLSASGGSFAGVEDPRAVIIDDTLYLSFSAFSGWDSLRIGVTSISTADLLAKRWKWTPPAYLSPIGEVHKNWVIFPEKIHGKFAVLHGFSEDRTVAHIDYLDTLTESPATPIRSDARFRNAINEELWDSKLRGAGPPPIRTNDGWLVLYHANDAREPHRYKLGALLLDLTDPTKVLARSPLPILAPDARYENEGVKAGIVYACGAVVRGDTLIVYYGGADSVVCAAKTSLSRFLQKLKDKKAPTLTPLKLGKTL